MSSADDDEPAAENEPVADPETPATA
jgi:hypothetical protein